MNLDGIKHLRSGKVRDIYEIDENLLIVATDRISAFDWVIENEIPGKGEVLTEISVFWFSHLSHIVNHHLITTDINDMPDAVKRHPDLFAKRSMLVKKAKVVPIECIVRGYITGSGWKEYKKSGTVCGLKLPENLVESEKLPEPVFTPSTKAETGHDENISFEVACDLVGSDIMNQLRTISLNLFVEASKFAESRGIIIADTKFEFGQLPNGEIILIDEVLTPDSSRFWPQNEYVAGRSQPSFDKQFVRDYLNTCDWDKSTPPPLLPQSIIDNTIAKYKQAKELLVD